MQSACFAFLFWFNSIVAKKKWIAKVIVHAIIHWVQVAVYIGASRVVLTQGLPFSCSHI